MKSLSFFFSFFGTPIVNGPTKHLGGEVRRLEMLGCYDYQSSITDEEKDIIFATKL
jgi:hypothetical protein